MNRVPFYEMSETCAISRIDAIVTGWKVALNKTNSFWTFPSDQGYCVIKQAHSPQWIEDRRQVHSAHPAALRRSSQEAAGHYYTVCASYDTCGSIFSAAHSCGLILRLRKTTHLLFSPFNPDFQLIKSQTTENFNMTEEALGTDPPLGA